MNLRQNESKRTIRAPAKLNLFLEIFGRREDGYHELATLMVPLRLFDSLSLKPLAASGSTPGEIKFRLHRQPDWPAGNPSTDQIPSGADNLVVRALELLRERSGCIHGAQVDLVKRIPIAAGLGGGSSDAAAALKLANRAWNIHWEPRRLSVLAAELGSDVPFFMSSGAGICRGRGECVTPLGPTVPIDVVIVKPPEGLNTSEVYRALDDSPAAFGVEPTASRDLVALTQTLQQGSLARIGRWMVNRLQMAAATVSPWIGQARSAFAELDFLGHQLSGSGTAYFGVCRHARHARRLASILKTRQLGLVYVTRSCR
jgi:4-diphosphocytidyl-2-C-methyl-D-erythritol kinase